MVIRTNNPAPTCLVQVIIPTPDGSPHVLGTHFDLSFFTYEIMVKAINFMPDRPPELLQFVDRLREIEAKVKID